MMPDIKPELTQVEAELEELLSNLSEAPGPAYVWWELGMDSPPAINAGLASNRLELVNVQADWYEHPHHATRFIRIQSGRIATPGAALPEEDERRVLADIKGPMLLRGEFRLTEAEKLRRTIRREMQAVFDEGRRRNFAPKKVTPLAAVISRRLAANEQPGTNVQWQTFCDSVRNDCNGWADSNSKLKIPKRGFGDKSIQRIVGQHRTPQSKTDTMDK
jgi:hypothetical protein